MTDERRTDTVPLLARLSGLALMVGLLAGLGAAVFVAAQHHLTHLLWHTLPETLGQESIPWWVTLGLPLIGAGLAWSAMRLPGHGGHGPLDGLGFTIGPREVGSVVLAALASLCFGAVLGPEAPLMAIGSAVGAAIVPDPRNPARPVMMVVGAAAAAGAVLGNPLATTILVLEIALAAGGAMTSRIVILPTLTGLAGGYLLQVGLGPWTGLGEVTLTMPGLPAYDNVRLVDLAAGVIIAAVVATLGYLAARLGSQVAALGRRQPFGALLAAGAVTGVAALLVSLATGQSPELIVLAGQSAMGSYLTLPTLGVAAIVLVGKFVAYTACLGGGFKGGALFPALAMGAIVAGSGALLMGTQAVPALVATAVAAATAGALAKPLTGVMLAVLLTISAGPAITVPAILGAVVGMIVRMVIDQLWPATAAADA